ncbi:DUF2165 family protein [Erythrobacter alti]|uniref:DUF2165 family protein n=1 Tax=Erythrobacter alti TaxID=1896145 RepID=UPI0030F40F65
MYRIIKILLALSIAAWALFGALGNVLDWSGTTGAVTATASMSTFEGGADNWRAITNPAVITVVAIMIPALKFTAGVFCMLGAWRMWNARKADQAAFQQAKQAALAGAGIAVILLFVGWIVFAETWFELWRSEPWREAALQSAFRYAGLIALMSLMIGARDD